MINMKATYLCATCLNRQYISPQFLWISIHLRPDMTLLRCANATLYQFALSFIRSRDALSMLCNSIVVVNVRMEDMFAMVASFSVAAACGKWNDRAGSES